MGDSRVTGYCSLAASRNENPTGTVESRNLPQLRSLYQCLIRSLGELMEPADDETGSWQPSVSSKNPPSCLCGDTAFAGSSGSSSRL